MIRGLKWLAMLASIGMFIVVLDGALVTKLQAGRGCGNEWPLCHGKFVPAHTLESLVEYSHRAVSGAVGLLVLLVTFLVFRLMKDRMDAKIYALGALFFTMLQAILGAMAVIWQQSSAVLALHFGFSLMAFACTLLLVIVLWQAPGRADNQKNSAVPVPRSLRNWIWFAGIYTYIVVYLGAFVRHTHSTGGCLGWPLCNGQVIPELSGATGIVFIHRVAAALLLLLILGITIYTRRKLKASQELGRAMGIALVLLAMQILSGAWLTYVVTNNDVYIFASLLHTMIISGFFGTMSYAVVKVWQLERIYSFSASGSGKRNAS